MDRDRPAIQSRPRCIGCRRCVFPGGTDRAALVVSDDSFLSPRKPLRKHLLLTRVWSRRRRWIVLDFGQSLFSPQTGATPVRRILQDDDSTMTAIGCVGRRRSIGRRAMRSHRNAQGNCVQQAGLVSFTTRSALTAAFAAAAAAVSDSFIAETVAHARFACFPVLVSAVDCGASPTVLRRTRCLRPGSSRERPAFCVSDPRHC